MTNAQILKKAIEKAVENGFSLPETFTIPLDEETKTEYCKYWIKNNDFLKIIFSHDFAKAIWGIKDTPIALRKDIGFMNENNRGMWNCKNCGNWLDWIVYLPAWQYHLQQMVLVREPLKYIEKFL